VHSTTAVVKPGRMDGVVKSPVQVCVMVYVEIVMPVGQVSVNTLVWIVV